MFDEDATRPRFTRRYASFREIRGDAQSGELVDAMVRGRLVNSDRGDDQTGVVRVANEALLSLPRK